MSYIRMLNKDNQPSENDILATIGDVTAWNDLRDYLAAYYDHEPELIFYGKKYGWTVRYRKSGKTLCSLFPECGAFTALVTLGKDEISKVLAEIDDYGHNVRQIIKNTRQLHDGRWLWIRVSNESDVDDIKRLLAVKRRPKKIQGQ